MKPLDGNENGERKRGTKTGNENGERKRGGGNENGAIRLAFEGGTTGTGGTTGPSIRIEPGETEEKRGHPSVRSHCGPESCEAREASDEETARGLSALESKFADGNDVPASDRNKFDAAVEHGASAGWLAPVGLEPKRQAVRAKKTERRASNKGFLTLSLSEYLQLLDWTARQIRTDKRGSTPAELEPLFERLEISAELWVDCVKNFRKWFRSSVGRPNSMTAHSTSKGHDRAISIRSARRVFA